MLRRTTTAMALSAVLMVGSIAGCGGQSASTGETTEAVEAAESGKADDAMVSELKDAIANAPAFTSVTATVQNTSTFKAQDGGEPTTIEGTTVYKFDEGDVLRSSTHTESLGITMEYYTDGDNAVLVNEGKAYGGTTAQFDLVQSEGSKACLVETTGDLETLITVASSVEKEQAGANTVYALVLDVDRYIESDENLATMAQFGGKVLDATVSITFDADGRIVAVDQATDYEGFSTTTNVTLSDFDATVVDEMPEPTATFDEMQADASASAADVAPEADAAQDSAE